MTDLTAIIGWEHVVPVPDVDDLIALGYTSIRIYYAPEEAGSYAVASTQTLVSGTLSYSYNLTTGSPGDWVTHAFYSVALGEGPRVEPIPVSTPYGVTQRVLRQAVGAAFQLVEVVTLTAATDSDTGVFSELIDGDRAAASLARRFARVSAGTAIGQVRRVKGTTNSGYVPASGTINLNRALAPVWIAGDEVELWLPRGDIDPGELINMAMNTARERIWIDDLATIITVEGQSEYPMPLTMLPDSHAFPEIALGTWPDDPQWQAVGFCKPYVDSGQLWMTVKPYAVGQQKYAGDKVLRIAYGRQVDEMDSDTDSWPVSLRWAQAEVAAEFCSMMLGAPTGGASDITDWGRSYGVWTKLAMGFRSTLQPAPKPFAVPIS